MNNYRIIALINFCLRLFTISGKFYLMLFLIKKLDLEAYGQYTIIANSIGFGVYFIGLDFYTYYSRKLINISKINWGNHIFSIFLYYLPIYFLFCVVLKSLSFFKVFDVKYLALISLLLLFEFYSQELYRITILLKKSVVANISVFIRNAAWILPFIYILEYQNASSDSLKVLMFFWIIGSVFSIVFSLYFIYRQGIRVTDYKIKKASYFIKGLRTSILFFSGTILLRLIVVLDKIIIKEFTNEESVGIFSFFLNIVMVSQTVIDVSIIGIYLPFLISKDEELRKTSMEAFTKKIFLVSIGIAVILFFSFEIIIGLSENSEKLSGYKNLYAIIILSNFFLNISNIPHYKLYYLKKDKEILISTFISFIIFISSSLIFIGTLGILGISLSILISYFALLISKLKFQLNTK